MLNRIFVILCLATLAPYSHAGDTEWNGERVARRGNPRLFGPEYGSGRPARYDFMTVYKPQDGGINGRCGGGGGTRPMNPCKHFLDDHLPGRAQCVVAATQRNGGTSSIYGCVGEATTMNQRFGKPVKICFADVYAGSQDPHKMRGRQRGKSKFDVAIKSLRYGGSRALQAKVTQVGQGQITCKGRTPGSQNVQRRATRSPAASSPIKRRG